MITTPSPIEIIGAPIDLGQGRRGVDMGPSAIRVADLDAALESLGRTVTDCGDIDVRIPETLEIGSVTLRYKSAIMAACETLRVEVERSLAAGRMPLVLGGDHSLSIGSIAGVSNHFRTQGAGVGVIWLDAHGDSNTPETTPSGNIHGMSLAVSMGFGDPELTSLGGRAPKVDPGKVVLIGVRDLDPGERDVLKRSGATVYTIREVDERGMRDVVKEAVRIAGAGTAGIHVSFDLDVLDPEDAPGVGTAIDGGITYREAHLAMEMLAESAKVVSVDLVEVNPVLDTRNQTALLAVELTQSLLGKRIL
ncbi:MAG TPA: arginase [Candidatus Eisenbacteria bacterium]|nr:arginase [Candidatus Eisenbacteria bacterium]